MTSKITRRIACGLPVVRLHDTRHGACSLLLAGGIPIEVVQMILGHSSPEITRKVDATISSGPKGGRRPGRSGGRRF